METSNEDGDSELDFWLNMTEAEYLDQMLGPKYLPMKLVIPLTIVYATIFVTGIFGNVATCFVIVKNASMQTATNYYLFSLAISDLTLLVLGLPNELRVFWQQYPWALGTGLCKIRAYVSEVIGKLLGRLCDLRDVAARHAEVPSLRAQLYHIFSNTDARNPRNVHEDGIKS